MRVAYFDVEQAAEAVLVDVQQGEAVVAPAHVDAGTAAQGHRHELVRLLQRQNVDVAVVGERQNVAARQTANARIVQLDLVVADVGVEVD